MFSHSGDQVDPDAQSRTSHKLPAFRQRGTGGNAECNSRRHGDMKDGRVLELFLAAVCKWSGAADERPGVMSREAGVGCDWVGGC